MKLSSRFEQITWMLLMLASIYTGFWHATDIVLLIYWLAWAAVAISYLLFSQNGAKELPIKLMLFISVTIAFFSLYGILISNIGFVDRSITSSQFPAHVKATFFHIVSILTAFVAAGLFTPVIAKVGGTHKYFYLLCALILPAIAGIYLYALYLLIGMSLALTLYKYLKRP
jgi:hypothetical protein